MKAKKEKAVQKFFQKEEISNIPSHSPLKSKHPEVSFTSFIRQRSVMVHKLLTDKHATAVAIMKHVWQQEYKHPEKRKLMNKFWKLHISLAQIMLDIGKHKGRKDQVKLRECVDKVKQKYNSLRQACWFADISWTKFHHHTYVKSKCNPCKKGYIHKLSDKDINSIEEHFQSDNISFPLPGKKYMGKRFIRYSVKHSARMYNLAESTRRKYQFQHTIITSLKQLNCRAAYHSGKAAVNGARILKIHLMRHLNFCLGCQEMLVMQLTKVYVNIVGTSQI